MMAEMSATGGVLLAAIAISNLLELRRIRTGSFLPALCPSIGRASDSPWGAVGASLGSQYQ